MAAFKLPQALQTLADHFDRIQDHILRPQHASNLAGKGPQVGQLLNLLSDKIHLTNDLRDNFHRKYLITFIENWVQAFRISNISSVIGQNVAQSNELRQETNSNALKFVNERLSDVDVVITSITSKQLDAGDCLKKMVHKDTEMDAAIKECKVFNYLVDWVAVDVEGCHKKLQLAKDRIAACGRKQSFPYLQLLLFAIGVPGFVVSTFFPQYVEYPMLVFAASLGLMILPLWFYTKSMNRGQNRIAPVAINSIPDPPIIASILQILADMGQ